MGEVGELIVSIIGDMEQLHNVFQDVQKEISGVGSSFSKVGKDLSSAGADLTTGVTAPIVAAGAAIGVTVAKATDFDTGMRRVATMLPGLTKEGFDDISNQALQLSQDFGTSTSEMTNAMYQALSSGIPKDNIFGFMQEAEKLAIGGATDVVTATDVLTNAVNSYGAANLSTAQASDILFQGTKFGKSTVEELAASLSNVVPVAASLGVGFDDVNASLATMTIQGTPTAQATTQLRAIIDELSDGTKGAGASFEYLAGKSFKQFIKEGGTVGEAMQILQKGTGQVIPDMEKLAKAEAQLNKPTSDMAKEFTKITGKSFPDFVKGGGNIQQALDLMGVTYGTTAGSVSDYFSRIEAGTGALQLATDGGKIYAQSMEGMQQAAGSTDEAYKTMSEGLGASLDRIKAAFEVIMIKVGEDFIPLIADTLVPLIEEDLIPFLEAIEPIIKLLAEGFNALPGPIKLIVLGAVALLAALGPVLMIAGAMATGIGAIAGLFGAGGALAGAGALVTGLVSALLPLAPAILAVLVVAGGLYLIFKNWDKIKEFASAPILYIHQFLYSTFKKIEKFLKGFDISKIILSLFFPIPAIVDAIFGTDMIGEIDEAFTDLLDYFDGIDFEKIGKDLFQLFIDGVSLILKAQPYKLVYTALKKVWDFISSEDPGSKGESLFERLIKGIEDALKEEPLKTVKDTINSVLSWLGEVDLGPTGSKIFNVFIAAIEAVLIPQPIGFVMGALTKVITYLGTIDLGPEATKIFNKFVEMAKAALAAEPLKSITAALEKVTSYLSTFSLSSAGSYIINSLVTAIKNILLTEPLKSIQEGLSKITSAVYSFNLSDAGRAIITSLKNGITALLQTEPIATIKTELTKISTYISNIDLSSTGKAYLQKFVNGIYNLLYTEPIATIQTGLSKVYNFIANYDLTSAGRSFLQKLVNGINALLETEPMASITKAITSVYNYFNYSNMESIGQSWLNKFVSGIKFILRTEPMASIYTAIGSVLNYLNNLDLASAGRHIIETLASGIRNAGSLAYQAVYDILQDITRLLPHSPAKEGPFSVLPNWDAIFTDPTETSLNKMRGTVLSGLETVAQIVNSSDFSSNPVTNHYGGDTISIGPNTIGGDMDLKKVIQELNRYTTAQKRARGLI